ncbi:uncharacterized protein [Palaemon carinicauda]|uniref:uncharacterized protein isoform X2 n=1 Tax=Palaemon carinicauda TaxID=392227 RepID=UPI0035B5CCCC
MYPAWAWGIRPHPPEATTSPATRATTPTTTKEKIKTTTYPSFPYLQLPPLTPPSPLPAAPHENQPSQVCSEKHRGSPSPSPQHILSQVTSPHNTTLLLYETCRHYLTLSHCWLGGVPKHSTTADWKATTLPPCDKVSSVHTKRNHGSSIVYFIQGCNIVQIMSPTPSSTPAPYSPVGDSVIRSNSPPSFYFAISSSATTTAPPSSTSSSSSSSGGSPSPPLASAPALPVHRHNHHYGGPLSKGMEGEEVRGGGALQRSAPCSWRKGRKCNSSTHFSSSSSGQSLLLLTLVCLLLAGGTHGSELPDRECCDSVPPPPPNYHHATSTTTTTTTPTPMAEFNASISITSHTGGVMNCIEARNQCLNDRGCKDVLQILHKVCGPELVACSSTTPDKCQMLLRTLRNFEFLTSCKCKEPHVDFACHSFRETIFSHPCGLVETDDYSEFTHPLMPNCNDEYQNCKDKASCLKAYVEFANVCPFSGITCMAQDGEKCLESWSKIRHSPLFGCICTTQSSMRSLASRQYSMDSSHSYGILRKEDAEQETCMETYNRTHENPCLAGHHDISKAPQVEVIQATCHVALEQCQSDDECRPLLDDVMIWCEHTHCEPDRCRTALQDFYDRVNIIRTLQVAFCVCRQNDPNGECLTAMRKLHPTCAERHSGRDPMKCHKIAEQCRKSPVCREKLRIYEQRCAADAMTGRCTDTHRNCQKAVMNILGTELHATCVCKGTDFLNQHDCYTWQKLLWSNPCVIESHLMLHKEISSGNTESLEEIFRRRPQVHTTPPPPPQNPYINPTPEEDEGDYGIIHEMSPDNMGPRPSSTYGQEHPGVWAPPHRPGITVGEGGRRDRIEGISYGRNGDIGSETGRGYPLGRNGYVTGETGRGPGIINIGRESGGSRMNGNRGFPHEPLPPGSKWNNGRNRGSGLNVGGRNGRFGGETEDTGSPWGSRGNSGGVIVGGGRGGNVRYDTSHPINSHGRDRGSGHRGTPILIAPTDKGSSWGKLGSNGRPRTNSRNRGGYPIGSVPGIPDEPGFPTTLPPVTPHPVGGIHTPTPPILPAPTPYLTTTTDIPTTTRPRRTCSIKNVKNEQMMNLEIPEGSHRRIYNTSDCSALCECRISNGAVKPEAICITLKCMENKSCNTESAKFPHSAPYYLAHRGACDCYDGNFICKKPDPDDYAPLGPGVYMFLGYSKGEMEILKPATSKNELDALSQMEEILVKQYGFKCTLTLKNHIGENVIAIAKLDVNPEIFMNAFVRQRREKEECARPLQALADKINMRPRHPDILTDAHLSMFILADVEVNFPEAQTSYSSAADHLRPDVALTYLLSLLALLLFQRRCLEFVTPLGAYAT